MISEPAKIFHAANILSNFKFSTKTQMQKVTKKTVIKFRLATDIDTGR